MTPEDVETFRRCIAVGGVALFPSDTVYGLATEPDSKEGVTRLYALKGRAAARPAAVMFFDLDLALAALPELGPRTRAAVVKLLPGALTLLLPNPAGRYPLACGPDPGRLGLRVPALTGPSRPWPPRSGPCCSPAPTAPGERTRGGSTRCPEQIRAGVDLQLDAGPLPGSPSTVVDLTEFEREGRHAVVREGAVTRAAVVQSLDGL